MAFDGSEGEQITINEAAQLTLTYRNNHPNDTQAHFIGKELLHQILAQSECTGIRIYYGIDNSKGTATKELVLVGADANENDLYLGIIADRLVGCPSNCSSPNPINT